MRGPRESSSGNRRSARRAAPFAGALLVVAFLGATLAPCPPRIPVEIAHASHPQECHATQTETFLTAPCACGCQTHAPIAGSSARLGVALLSAAPDLAPRLVAELSMFVAPRFDGSFTTPIDHIPLPA